MNFEIWVLKVKTSIMTDFSYSRKNVFLIPPFKLGNFVTMWIIFLAKWIKFYKKEVCFKSDPQDIEKVSPGHCKSLCLKSATCAIYTETQVSGIKAYCELYPKVDYSTWTSSLVKTPSCATYISEEMEMLLSKLESMISIIFVRSSNLLSLPSRLELHGFKYQ